MKPSITLMLIIVFILLTQLFIAYEVQAATLNPGDIFVCSESTGNIYKIDPVSGVSNLISSGGLLNHTRGMTFDNQAQLFTIEESYKNPGIIRIDPITGIQTLISSGSGLSLTSLTYDQNNNNLIVGNSPSWFHEQVLSINKETGTQSLLASLTNVHSIQDIEVDQQGQFIVADWGVTNAPGNSQIIRINPTTGEQMTVATGGYLCNPSDMLISPSGDYIVANQLSNKTAQLLSINPDTGTQQIITNLPYGGFIASLDQNNIVYTTELLFSVQPSIIRVNLLTGEKHTLTTFDSSVTLRGITVYSPIPEPSTFLLLGIGAISLAAYARRRRK
jgi:hypothetical protein